MSGKAIEALLPHHLSHYIGLDVHDTPGQSRNAPLQARQCVTVEPFVLPFCLSPPLGNPQLTVEV